MSADKKWTQHNIGGTKDYGSGQGTLVCKHEWRGEVCYEVIRSNENIAKGTLATRREHWKKNSSCMPISISTRFSFCKSCYYSKFGVEVEAIPDPLAHNCTFYKRRKFQILLEFELHINSVCNCIRVDEV